MDEIWWLKQKSNPEPPTLNPMPCLSELLKKYIKFKGRNHWEALEAKMLYFMYTVGDLSFIYTYK